MPIMVENINAQTITPANGRNPRQLYEHQEDALRKLDAMDKKESSVLCLCFRQAAERL